MCSSLVQDRVERRHRVSTKDLIVVLGMWETAGGAPAVGSASWIISLKQVSLKRYRAKKPRTNHLLAMRDPAFSRHHSYLGFRTELENRVGDAGVMPVVRRGQVTQVKMESTGNRRNSCLGEADSASSHENRSAQGCATCMVSRQPSKSVRNTAPLQRTNSRSANGTKTQLPMARHALGTPVIELCEQPPGEFFL